MKPLLQKYAKAFVGGVAGAVIGALSVIGGGSLEWQAIVIGAAAGFVLVAAPVAGIPNKTDSAG